MSGFPTPGLGWTVHLLRPYDKTYDRRKVPVQKFAMRSFIDRVAEAEDISVCNLPDRGGQ